MFYILLGLAFLFTSFPSFAKEEMSNDSGKAKATKRVKLSNVKLVVEDPTNDYVVKEKLVEVSPVALRQKPTSVPIVHMNSVSVKMPLRSVLETSEEKKGVAMAAPQNVEGAEQSSGQLGSVDSNAISPSAEQKPLLVSKSSNLDSPAEQEQQGLPNYSPFHPPPPGFIPSTLVSPQALTQSSFGQPVGEDSLPSLAPEDNLPPLTAFQSEFSPPLPRIARATLASSSDAAQPSNPQNVSPSFPAPSLQQPSTFLTDSEGQALLDIAGQSGQAGPPTTVVGKTW
jgi:hypothetical protein